MIKNTYKQRRQPRRQHNFEHRKRSQSGGSQNDESKSGIRPKGEDLRYKRIISAKTVVASRIIHPNGVKEQQETRYSSTRGPGGYS